MDNQTISAEERLKEINEERKDLKEKVKSERTLRLEKVAKMRIERDKKIELIQEELKEIQKLIYNYNKLGKVAKMECNILQDITNEIESEWNPNSENDGTQTSTSN